MKFEAYFSDIRTYIEKSPYSKDGIFIIEYLIHFLGCVVLNALSQGSLNQLNKEKNISNLTSGEWVKFIENAMVIENNNRLNVIKKYFFDSNGIKRSIKRWIELRNIFSHEVILPDSKTIKQECSKKFINPLEEYDKFINPLIDVLYRNSNILNSPFFKLQDETLYIYSGIEDRFLKYRHYSKLSLQIERPKDFPITIKEIFISLDETKNDFLWDHDPIILKMKAAFSKTYINEFQLELNGVLVKSDTINYKDGEVIEFDTAKLPSDSVNFTDLTKIGVKALRNGQIQAHDEKYIKIYKIPPEPDITWDSGIKTLEIPIGIEYPARCSLNTIFDISDLTIYISGGHKLLKISEIIGDGKKFFFTVPLPFMSDRPCSQKIDITATYKDRIGNYKEHKTELYINFNPNFFKPEFTGEERLNIINKLTESPVSFLISGEGGTGKTRLVQEFLKRINKTPNIEITIYPASSLISELANKLGLYDNNGAKKKNKDEIIEKIIKWVELNKNNGYLWWIQDCHEISRDEDMDILRHIYRITSQSNFIMILETRDSSWSNKARKVIQELQTEGIKHIYLERLNTDDLIRIINSVFFANNFPEEFKKLIVKKSDGIVYILLQCLKNLYDEHYIIYSDSLPNWLINKPLERVIDILEQLDYNKVIKISVEPVIDLLDKQGYGEKARDLMRYLCFSSLTLNGLEKLLNLEASQLLYIIEKLKNSFIITSFLTNIGEVYKYHHQIKRDFCKKEYLPVEMECDYHLLAKKYDEYRRHRLMSSYKRYIRHFSSDEEVKVEDYAENNQIDYDDYDYNVTEDCLLNLHEPHLMEKVDYLLEHYHDYNIVNPLLIMKTYIHLFDSDAKFFGYLSYILYLSSHYNIFYGGIKIPFDSLENHIKEIESLIKDKGIDEYSPYYLAFMANFESWKVHEKILIDFEGIYDLDNSYCSSDFLFGITPNIIIKNDIAFLEDCIAKLENAESSSKLSAGTKFKYPEFYSSSFFSDIPDDYYNNEDSIIFILHSSAILAFLDREQSEKYIKKYKDTFKRCYILFRDKMDERFIYGDLQYKDIFKNHLYSLIESGVDIKFLLESLDLEVMDWIEQIMQETD